MTHYFIEPDSTIRVLHLFVSLERGGAETWFMHILRHIDRKRFHMDVMVRTDKASAYEDEAHFLGSKVLHAFQPSHLWRNAQDFKKILHQHGPYDIIHCHVRHFSGYVLYLAHKMNIPVRIIHIHSDNHWEYKHKNIGTAKWLYRHLMKFLIQKYATMGLAVSQKAAISTFGKDWVNDNRWKVLYCGIDTKPFSERIDVAKIRNELNIPPQAFVVGHVGRFVTQKNHTFIVDIASEILKQEPNAYFLLIGEGPLRSVIEKKVAQQGLSNSVAFIGERSDVPRLMMEAMDMFVFPSLYEGLGLVLIEAQAAGIPCVFSNVVPEEADVVKPLIHRVSLSASASEWANTILAARYSSKPTLNHLDLVDKSNFSIHKSVEQLVSYYETAVSEQKT